MKITRRQTPIIRRPSIMPDPGAESPRPASLGSSAGYERTSGQASEVPTHRDSTGVDRPDPSRDADEENSKTMTFAQATGFQTQPLQPLPIPREPRVASESSGLPKAFGRYQVRRALGQGGFGKVYVGYDAELDREVA